MYLVVLFSLYLKEDINEDGSVKEGAEDRAAASVGNAPKQDDDHDEEQALKAAREKLGEPHGEKPVTTSADDVD